MHYNYLEMQINSNVMKEIALTTNIFVMEFIIAVMDQMKQQIYVKPFCKIKDIIEKFI